MLDIVYWLFARIGDVVNFALSFHIVGSLSLLHFIIAFGLLVTLLKFLSFGNFNLGTTLGFYSVINNSLTNAENKLDKQNYYNYSVNHRFIDRGKTESVSHNYRQVYRVNRKTGEAKEISRSQNRTHIERGRL